MNPNALWDLFYPNDVGYDFSGRKIIKAHYGRTDLVTGWNIDHIIAKSIKPDNSLQNLIIVNCRTNLEKANKNTFVANGNRYQVKRINGVLNIVKI